ncbi:MAG TPA: hypothetical protein VL022_09355 [Moheibacter sp.]|nr:hypothetical protein [Moheibacter sp.]
MLDWLNTLSWYEKALWVLSIVFSLLFFCQMLSTVILKTPGKKRNNLFSRFFSFKNICAFLSMFGWVSISGIYQNYALTTALIFGCLSGLVLMVVMNVLFYYTQKIKEN